MTIQQYGGNGEVSGLITPLITKPTLHMPTGSAYAAIIVKNEQIDEPRPVQLFERFRESAIAHKWTEPERGSYFEDEGLFVMANAKT